MLYNNIKTLCKKNCMSISQLEQSVNLGTGSVKRWNENIPSVDKVKRVADYFGVTVDELLKD